MEKEIREVYKSNQLTQILTLLNKGEEVWMDVETASYLFKTQMSQQQIYRFVENGSTLLKDSEFIPISYDQRVKDFFTSQLLIQSTRSVDLEYARTIVDLCESFIQQYEFNIDDPKSTIAITATTSEEDFKMAKNTLLEILRNFASGDPENMVGVNILVRQNGQIMNVEIINLSDDIGIQISF